MLLPQPEGPISAVILLRGMSIVMSLSARRGPVPDREAAGGEHDRIGGRERRPAARGRGTGSPGHGRARFGDAHRWSREGAEVGSGPRRAGSCEILN